MSSHVATFDSCRRSYLRRAFRMGVTEIEPRRGQLVQAALAEQPRRRKRHVAQGWSICRLCDALYRVGARSYLKGFAIVRCTECGAWQRTKVEE